MPRTDTLSVLEPVNRPSVADAVFDALRKQILLLELPPGTRLSEVDVAKAMGVSRQPVRDAFYRLSKLGFLAIRPQRATMVSLISTKAVMQSRFIRTALEAETARAACNSFGPADHAALAELLERQKRAADAGDPLTFYHLDDEFHREICERSGHGYAWETVRESKAHMDRVRFLSLSFANQDSFDDHVAIAEAIRAKDAERASMLMRRHLVRIKSQILRIRDDHKPYFAEEAELG